LGARPLGAQARGGHVHDFQAHSACSRLRLAPAQFASPATGAQAPPPGLQNALRFSAVSPTVPTVPFQWRPGARHRIQSYGTTHAGPALILRQQMACTVFPSCRGQRRDVLYSFSGGTDADCRMAGWSGTKHNNLYGTTRGGGSAACNGDRVRHDFRVSAAGSFSTLYTFSGGSDGSNIAGLTIAETAISTAQTSAGA